MDMSFVLLDTIFLLRSDSLLSKSVFFTKFSCTSLALTASVADLLNSVVVIYLSWLWSVSFFSLSVIFVSQPVFLTKLLVSGALFSTVLNAEVVARPVILGIYILTSLIFVLRLALVARLLISGILSSIFFIFSLYSVFLMTSFSTTSLNVFKSVGTGANLSISNLSALVFNLLNLFFKLPNLSTSVFKLAKFVFNAKLEVSTCVIF